MSLGYGCLDHIFVKLYMAMLGESIYTLFLHCHIDMILILFFSPRSCLHLIQPKSLHSQLTCSPSGHAWE
jgi:hypothetical protein